MPLLKEFWPKPGLRAAAVPLGEHKGALLLVSDFADGAQWQPPQMAYHDLTITAILPSLISCHPRSSPPKTSARSPVQPPSRRPAYPGWRSDG